MKAVVLIDNISKNELMAEWGLSIYMEYGDRKVLLDCGSSENFSKNADMLGIDLSAVSFMVLSHAHYDHADGMDTFLEKNKEAYCYICKASEENCYSDKEEGMRYIGIKHGILGHYHDRLKLVTGKLEITPGIWVLPHGRDLSYMGEHAGQYTMVDGKFVPDAYRHEQSLIFETEKGLVVFNSCSHGGVMNILEEVKEAFPGKTIYAMIGGFHLFCSSRQEIDKLGEALKDTGVKLVITGHCTGDEGFEILKEKLKGNIEQMYCGMSIDL